MINKIKKEPKFPNLYWLIALVVLTVVGGVMSYLTFFIPILLGPGERIETPWFSVSILGVIVLLIFGILMHLLLQARKIK